MLDEVISFALNMFVVSVVSNARWRELGYQQVESRTLSISSVNS